MSGLEPPYAERLDRLRSRFRRRRVEALLVSHAPDVRYLTGFRGEGTCVVTRAGAFLVTDFRYAEAAAGQDAAAVVVAERGTAQAVAAGLRRQGVRCLGFDDRHLTVAGLHRLEGKLPGVRLVPRPGDVEALRSCKDEGELALVRAAARAADRCMEHALGALRPGRTERELAWELEDWLRRQADGPSFPIIVASGANGALPHAEPGERRLQAGDLVTIDLGALVAGYASDLTRTVCLGRPSEEQALAYRTVWQAQQRALAEYRPGMRASAADAAARAVIAEAGYGEHFGHALGHGVGLEIHEAPRLGPRSRDILAEGMRVTCEPGIYLPGRWGIRIEDLVLVAGSGPEVLSRAPNPEQILEI